MTFEEAKKIFLNRGYIEVPGGTYYDADKWRESVTVISEWLEQESCEDCISRKDMLAILSQSHSLTQAWDGFEKLSSVTLKEKTGHWKSYCYQNNSCSVCEYIIADSDTDEYKYCPNCGARMVSE